MSFSTKQEEGYFDIILCVLMKLPLAVPVVWGTMAGFREQTEEGAKVGY